MQNRELRFNKEKFTNIKVQLILILLLGFILRFYHIDKFGIWSDEEVSILTANGQYYDINSLPKVFDNHFLQNENTVKNVVKGVTSEKVDFLSNNYGNFLFYDIMLHYWVKIFGNSDLSVRLLSLLFGLLLIILSYKVSLLLSNNKKLSLLIAFLVAIHPLFIAYSQEARAYTTATFFSLLSSYFFFMIVFKKDKRSKIFIFYSLSVVIAMLSHYLTYTIFISHAIIFILFVRDRASWQKYSLAVLCSLTLFSIWLYFGGFEGLKNLASNAPLFKEEVNNYELTKKIYFVPATLKNIIAACIQDWLWFFGIGLQNLGLQIRYIALLLIIPLGMVIYLLKKIKNDKNTIQIIISLLILIFTQTFLAIALSINSGNIILFQNLYTNFVVPYAMILLGYSLFNLFENQNKKLISYGATSFFVIIMLISCIPIYFKNENSKFPEQNIHYEIAQNIKFTYNKNDTILIKSPYDARLINLYLDNDNLYIQKIDTNLPSMYLIKKNY